MLYLYCDGAIEPKNPGGHGVGGWVLKDETGRVLAKGCKSYGQRPDMTNNIAEYGAVIAGLDELVQAGKNDSAVVVRSDSELVIKQLRNEYACRNLVLRKMRDKVHALLEHFEKDVTFEWVPREENTEADEMSRYLYTNEAVVPNAHVTWFEF